MIYEVPPPAYSQRFFSRAVHYSGVDWSSLPNVVDAYRQRIDDWYLSPAKQLSANIHFAFAVMALDCLLIDTFSQYFEGRASSDRNAYKRFVRTHLPGFSLPLPAPIAHDDGKGKSTLADVPDVLYHGFRCGILHQAHMPAYCGVVPGGDRVAFETGLVVYKATAQACPSVILNPLALLDDIDIYFQGYLAKLVDSNPAHDSLRQNFKATFSACFGVDIASASI
jgi:hypothetical protein